MVKINGMPTTAFGEKYQVIETVAMRKNKALVFVNVIRKARDHDMVFAVFGKRADVEPGK